MGNRTAKFISAVIGSIIAGVPLTAVSQSAPSTQSAASDCLASPKGTAPQGQHWFYRVERSTKRQCWYLREAGAKAAPATQTSSPATQTAAPATQVAEATPTPSNERPTSHSVQDARAEFPLPQTAPARAVTAPAPTAAAPAQPQAAVSDTGSNQAAVEARQPDPAMVSVTPAPPPIVVTPKFVDAKPVSKLPAAASAGTMTLASADVSADRPAGSLQTLLLVIVGALALAGLLASVIYRIAGSRLRVAAIDGHRRVNWDRFEPPADDRRAPWMSEPAADFTPRAQRPRPVDFDLAPPIAITPAAATETTAISDAHPEPLVADIPARDDGPEQVEHLPPQEDQVTLQADPIEALVALSDAPDAEAEHSDTEAVNIDAITAILERLAQEGPRLVEPRALSSDVEAGSRQDSASMLEFRAPLRFHRNENDSSPEADLADFVQSRLARSAARA